MILERYKIILDYAQYLHLVDDNGNHYDILWGIRKGNERSRNVK